MTALPQDIIPNFTDPENTASNGPAVLNEDTLAGFHGEENLIRVRSQAPENLSLIHI